MTKKPRPTWFDVGKSDAQSRKAYRPPEALQGVREMYRQGYESVCPLRTVVINDAYVYLDARNSEAPQSGLTQAQEGNANLALIRSL